MDYTIRAVRAGFRAVWARGAYVYRHPFTARRRQEEQRKFEASKRRYQDKFCGLHLRGERRHYASHCRGEGCPHFAPSDLIERCRPLHPKPGLRSASHRPFNQNSRTAADGQPPLVSCIMPTCNRPDWVRQAISYFERQDYPHRELIIVDDGDIDLSDQLPSDPAIRYIRLDHRQSIGAKRNLACTLAKGAIVAQWDDDDWYAPNRISFQVEPILVDEADITGLTNTTFLDLERWEFWNCTQEFHARIFRNDVHGGTLVYRKQLFENSARYPDTSLAEDAEFLARTLAGGARLRRLSGAGVYVYVRHGRNSWEFRCGQFLDSTGWREQQQPEELNRDRAFYETRSTAARLNQSERPEFASPDGLVVADTSLAPIPGDDSPLVSCIMPTFNRRSFMPRAIDYFLRQNYANRELVIFDDGTDSIADLVPAHPQIRYHRQEGRQTVGAKRNAAIEASRGEIVIHWDDDDWMDPCRISIQVAGLVSSGADICGASEVVFCEMANGRLWLYRYPETGRRWLCGGTLCYRRSLWTHKQFSAISDGEDTRFVWAPPQGEMLDIKPFTRLVAMIHPGNTCTKQIASPYWLPWDDASPESLMGNDWPYYQSMMQ
jgi:glycosyltransferase involved in cell wall biosynthesis